MNAEIVNGNLVVTIPVEQGLPLSPSGKTRRVASSRGNVLTSATIEGKPITIGFNAWVSAK